MRNVIVLEEAAEDLEIGREFYDASAPGVGAYFVESLLSDIESLTRLHGIHPIREGFYRMLAGRFPFGIYYEQNDVDVRVFAVLDLRRDPSWIHDELEDRK